jgi:flagellar biosynthesis protein FlhG
MTGWTVAVASGKGGVGKTFLAIALTQSLGQTGRRALLIDADAGLANVDVQLGLHPKSDLVTLMNGQMTLADTVTPACGGAGTRGGFDVIAGRSGSGALHRHGGEAADIIIKALPLATAHYDATVLDMPAGVDPATLKLAAACGRVLTVLTDEPTSLTDAYALIKLLSQSEAPPHIDIAVNMAADAEDGRRSYEALLNATKKFLGLAPPLAGIVLRDNRVREAIRAQMPYLTRSPAGTAAAGVTRLAENLAAPVTQSPMNTRLNGLR